MPDPTVIMTRGVSVVDATATLTDGREVPVVRVTVTGTDPDDPDVEHEFAFVLPPATAGDVASRIIRHANDAVTSTAGGTPHE